MALKIGAVGPADEANKEPFLGWDPLLVGGLGPKREPEGWRPRASGTQKGSRPSVVPRTLVYNRFRTGTDHGNPTV